MLLLDDYSNYLWIFPLAHKFDVYDEFLIFHAHIRTQFACHIKNVQCDNGREFDNSSFPKFCE